ncbi:MAG: restriction endonuclease subunit S [Methanotrichaceae archaeon]
MRPCYPSDTTFYLEWKKDIDVSFLFNYLVLNPLSGEHAKTTLPSLQKPDLENYLIPLPPLPEQHRIAAVLSAVQDAKEKTGAVIAAAKSLKKSLMRHLFTYGPVPAGAAESVPLTETEIGLVPEGWDVVRLGDVGHFRYGYTTSATEEDTGTKFLRITDIKEDGVVNWGTVPYGIIDAENLQKFKLFEGDVLFARIGATTGKTCIIEGAIPNAVFASYLIRFVSNKELHPKYVFYFTQTREYQELVNAGKEGKLKKGLSATELKNFKTPRPPLPTQQKIASILSTVDQKIEAEENKKKALDELFKSLLHNLMTGKIRVNHLEAIP